MSSEAQTGTRHQYVAIGLVAASMLMHEILLTRVCALRLYFHFAFLVISNCLLGLGASGALLVRYQSEWKAEPRRHLTRFSLAYTASLVGTYFFLLRFPIPENLDLGDTPQLLTLTVYNLAGAVPFLFGGLVIGMLLTFHVERASRLYAVDLIGAGIGCIACPALLPLVGGGGVFLVSTLLALAGTFALGRPYFSRAAVAGLGAAGLLGLALVPSLDQRMPVPSKGLLDYAKAIDQALKLGEPFSVWTANSRIDMFRVPPGAGVGVFMRGTNIEGLPTNVPSAGIAQDATAGTSLLDYTGHPEALEHLRRSMYQATYRLKDKPKVLIIGLGGGNDAWAARDAGARSIKAIELNWPIVDIHRRALAAYSRDLVQDPTVELVVGEGRSALMRQQDRYDVIQMSGIDTWTALASGAYVLAENYLYTRECIASMYSRLEPDGIIQIARFSEAMEALRLLSNIHAALEPAGVRDLSGSVMALHTRDKMMAIQVKKGVFTEDEQQRTAEWAERVGIDVAYMPGRRGTGPVEDFIRSADKQRIIDTFPMNITPTDDDQPYFFNYTRWQHPFDSVKHMGDIPSVSQGNPFFLLSQLLFALVLAAIFIVLPVARGSSVGLAGSGGFLAFFSALGLGFIFLEIAVIQKLTLFLGQPVYSLTVTLFSLLVFTGLGSLTLGARFAVRDSRVWIVPIGILAYVTVFSVVSPLLVEHLITLPVGARIAITIALLAPLGFLLGVPFAWGLRVLDAERPDLTPWAWAINGSLSVVGSVATVVVSMNFGFRAVLFVAAGVYLLGFLALRSHFSGPARPAT